MNTTPGWLLYVLLANNVAADLGPQPDCMATGARWLRAANAWRERIGAQFVPIYSCRPPEVRTVKVSEGK